MQSRTNLRLLKCYENWVCVWIEKIHFRWIERVTQCEMLSLPSGLQYPPCWISSTLQPPCGFLVIATRGCSAPPPPRNGEGHAHDVHRRANDVRMSRRYRPPIGLPSDTVFRLSLTAHPHVDTFQFRTLPPRCKFRNRDGHINSHQHRDSHFQSLQNDALYTSMRVPFRHYSVWVYCCKWPHNVHYDSSFNQVLEFESFRS